MRPGLRGFFDSMAEYFADPGPEREADPREPVKLLYVNDETTADGVVPVFFAAHPKSGVFYPSVVIEVRPEEFEEILAGRLELPNGWVLGEEFFKAAATGHRDAV